MPKYLSDRLSEYMADRMSNRMSEYMSVRIPGRMPDGMSEYMPDNMSAGGDHSKKVIGLQLVDLIFLWPPLVKTRDQWPCTFYPFWVESNLPTAMHGRVVMSIEGNLWKIWGSTKKKERRELLMGEFLMDTSTKFFCVIKDAWEKKRLYHSKTPSTKMGWIIGMHRNTFGIFSWDFALVRR